MDWPTVTLSEVAEINPRLPKGMRSQSEMDVAFLQMASVSEQGGILDVELRKLEDVVKGFTYFAQGDVIVAKITPCMENGKAAYINHRIPTEIGFGSTEFHVIRPGPKLDGKYLFHLIWSDKFRFIAEKNMTGTAGQKRVPTSFIQRYKFALPPLDEQRRIAAILDKAEEIKSSSKSVPHLRQQLILSTFNEMFGDLRINSKSWPVKSISELCDRVTVGYVGPLTPLYVESGIRCLRGLNIKRGRISNSDIKQISSESHNNLLKKSRLNAGDVVAIRTGNAGVSAVISEEYDDINCADLIIMTPGSEIEPSYLCEFLNQKFGDAASIQGAVGAIQKHFNIGSAKKVMVPLPPLKLQNEHTRFLDAITQLDDQIEFAEKTSLSLAQDLLA